MLLLYSNTEISSLVLSNEKIYITLWMCHWKEQADGESTTNHLSFVAEETDEDLEMYYVLFSQIIFTCNR